MKAHRIIKKRIENAGVAVVVACIACSRAERSEPPPAPSANVCLAKGGPITTDTTFSLACSPYDLPGGIDVINGATLTIEAGVEVRFHAGDWLEIGATGRPGRLVAQGTKERPIVLTSADPVQPDGRRWLGLWFHAGTLEGSVLAHAVVEKGGGTNAFIKPPLEQGCLTFTGVRPDVVVLTEVRLRECDHGGLRLTTSAPRLEHLAFEQTKLAAVADPASFGSLPAALGGDALLEVHVQSGAVVRDARWFPQRAPVLVDGDVSVAGPSAPSLTLMPGVRLRFAKGARLRVGYEQQGALLAIGTASERIELGAEDKASGWSGVELGPLAAPTSAFEFIDVHDATSAAIQLESAGAGVRIRHAIFADNALDIALPCGAAPTLADNRSSAPGKVKRRAPCP